MGNTSRPGTLPSGLVTFLFTDIEGSTRLAHRLGDRYREVLHEHRRILREVFSSYTGTELLTEGDSFFVAFSRAAHAIAAAVEVQRALNAHHWPTDPSWYGPARPKVRVGIHSATATPDAQGYATSAVHRAARVCAAAHGDQILCTQSTIDSAEALPSDTTITDMGLHQLRGFDDTNRLVQVAAFDLKRSFPAPAAQPRHHNIPADTEVFVGRETELMRLSQLVARHRLVTVTALPKTGKSRLARSVARRLSAVYRDGVCYTPLHPRSDGAASLAKAMGLCEDPFRPILDIVIESLRAKACLLVLDDADESQLPWVHQVLAECPRVTILTTAQRPIGLPGEVKWALPPMQPDESSQLLRQRATAHSGGADPGDCRELADKVDGFLPALDVLARAVPLVRRAELLRRLRADPLGLLDTEGELSHVLNQAYAKLSPHAARLLRALSALPAPTSVEDIEKLAQGSAALGALIELVDTTFVAVERDGEFASYRLPAPIRCYAELRRRTHGASQVPHRKIHYPLPVPAWTRTTA